MPANGYSKRHSKKRHKKHLKGRKKLRRRSVDQTKDALREFVRQTACHGKRLDVLRWYADVVLACACPTLQAVMRQSANQSRALFWVRRPTKRCFCGCGRQAVHAHHVIQLQNGGADILKNKVPVCEECHADIHPWMPAQETIRHEFKPFWG